MIGQEKPAATTWTGRTVALALYVAFALAVFLINGPQPPISIDHIAYFKIADAIRAAHPHGDYWRDVGVIQTYGVIMAYLYGLTGNHVLTLRILLVLMTVAYLLSAETLFARWTIRRPVAVAFSLLSALHVSFGSVFWGVTDFEASLNRTLVVPPLLLLLAWYFPNYWRLRRVLVYPALILLSVLHLGTYYLLAVLVLMDGIRLARSFFSRSPARLGAAGAYAGGLALVGVAYLAIQPFNLKHEILVNLMPRIEDGPAGAVSFSATPRASPARLSSAEAWRMELFAQPWRNFPLPVATLLAAVASLAFIAPLSAAGGYFAIKRSGWRPFDKPLLLMAGSIVVCSYTLQGSLWVIRRWVPIYPLNFEEVRTISLIYLPILYFAMRGFEWIWFANPAAGRRIYAGLAALIFIIQPLYLVRILPRDVRERILSEARDLGVLDKRETQRTMYARQVLRLEPEGKRFYYSVIPVFDWLKSHTTRADRILTNRDELFALPAAVIGTSNGFLESPSSSPRRLEWERQVLAFDRAVAMHDTNGILAQARREGAKYAVVPWSEPGSVYDDGVYSVLATE